MLAFAPMKSDGSRTITWHGQERRRHLSAIGSSLPASDTGVAIGPEEVRIPSKRLSVPAGRGCRALLVQATLERVEEDGCHSSPPRHVRN